MRLIMETGFRLHQSSNMSQYQIKIDKPCHENWNAMTQKEQGKFCGVCTKDVIDFTSMSDQEVKSYFTNYKGSLCGRFNANQLEQKNDRYFTLPDYTKKFIRAFAMAFLMFTAIEMQGQAIDQIKGDVAYHSSFEITHKGLIYGMDGKGIKNVIIKFYQNGVLKKKTRTVGDGSYTLTLQNGNYEVHIIKLGFQTIITDIKVNEQGTVGDFELASVKKQPIDRPIMGMIKMGKPVMNKK